MRMEKRSANDSLLRIYVFLYAKNKLKKKYETKSNGITVHCHISSHFKTMFISK